jgi:hypothetical protein
MGKVQEFNAFKRDITLSESYNRNSNVGAIKTARGF